MTKGDLGVFIPAYNAAETLPGVLARIPAEIWLRIRSVTVVDDGSRDKTLSVAENLAKTYAKIQVRTWPQNRGYGSAVRLGLEACLQSGCEVAVCLHADGQYPPERLGEFANHMLNKGLDILQGSRHRDGRAGEGGMPRYKIVAGTLLTRLENRCLGHRLTDPHSGFLFYSRRALQTVPFQRLSGYFDFDLEVIACALALGLRVDELGIPARYAGELSYLNPVRYGFHALRMAFRYRMGYYGRLAEGM